MGRSANLYGADDNAFAESIASAALSAPDSDRHSGNPVDQEARSKSSPKTDEVAGQGEATVKAKGGGNDSRAVSKDNH